MKEEYFALICPILARNRDNEFFSCRYFSSSPPPLSPEGREDDINAILNVIRGAKRFIHIAVMDFVPMFIYTRPKKVFPIYLFYSAIARPAGVGIECFTKSLA